MGKFVKFKDPTQGGLEPIAKAIGTHYYCAGCNDVIPSGAWIFENVEGDMIIGVTARNGGADAPIVHQCGVNK